MKFLENILHYKIQIISFCIIIISLFLHAYNLTTVPSGLYLDETSIGINAGNIALHGVDEYGKSFPLYFEAFGEWKNPLYIYVSAGIMKIFGISEFTLRFTSVFFFGIFLFGIYLFVSEIFKNTKHRNYLIYFALVSASVTPWFFTLSRVAFEVISQISTGIFVLYFLYKYYVSGLKQSVQNNIFGIFSGISLGLFLYSYSTSKLIVFGILFALFISFFEKKYWKKHLIISASFLLFLLPYLYFSYTHSGALSARFELLTYLYNSDFSVIEKISIFLKNYFASYDISNFLLFEGDKNLRHSTGFMGQIFFVTFVLFIIGVYKILSEILNTETKSIKSIKNRENLENIKYKLFLLILLVGAPISASLTTDLHHSLRLLFFGFIIFIFSLYGAEFIFQKYNTKIKKSMIFLLLLIPTVFQSYFYFSDYFDKNSGYAKRAILWFDGNKFEAHVQIAISSSGDKIYVFENPNDPFYANVDFFNMQTTEFSIIMTKKSSVISDAKCVIVPRKNIQEFQQKSKKYNIKLKLNIKLETNLFTTYCLK